MKQMRKLICVMLSGMLLLCAAGCRPSMTFTEIVYDQMTDDILDEAMLQQLDNEADNEEKDDRITSVAEDDQAGTERGRNRQDPSPGTEDNDQSVPDSKRDTTLMQKFRGDTPQEAGGGRTDQTVPQGSGGEEGEGAQNGNTDPNGSGAVPGGENGGSGEGPGGAGSGGQGSGDPSGGGAGNGGMGGTEEGNGPLREIVDANGRVVTIPQDVHSLTATGELALIVEMLGGGDKLLASSASIKEGMAGRCFGSWSGSVLWDGDGSAPMNDSAFGQLLEQAPQVCLIQSGDVTFTDAQLQQLAERGIQYITLPPLINSDCICETVRLTGEVLQSQDKASEYIDYVQDVQREIRSVTGTFRPDGIDYRTGWTGGETGSGVYALYISGWDSSAAYSLRNQSSEVIGRRGMAVAETSYLGSPMTEMLSLAGIANSAALTENNYSLSNVKRRFVNPIINNLYELVVRDGSMGASYKKEYAMTTAGGFYLGEEEFPAVIAGTREAFEGIAAEKAGGLWQACGELSIGRISGYGFADSEGNLVESTIHGDYILCVAPSGAGSWAKGSVESILLPHWAAWRVRGLVSENDVRNRIADFYQRFYGAALSEDDISSILAGR